MVASAAKGERAAAVINQVNQALQQGELRGDAFNSVIRNTPALADALARGLGKTREELTATGSITELDKLEQQIKDIDRSLAGTGLNRTLAGLWYSKEELQAQRQALLAMRELLVTEQTGMNADQRNLEEERRKESERQNSAALADYRKYINDIDTLRKSQIKAAEAGAKASTKPPNWLKPSKPTASS
ncbi:putative tail protein [Ectopseudomonas mendocina DLHK]|nr:putative tail protein [Pseudomonas mendocina DLHK]